jgi:hypothetical protein
MHRESEESTVRSGRRAGRGVLSGRAESGHHRERGCRASSEESQTSEEKISLLESGNSANEICGRGHSRCTY